MRAAIEIERAKAHFAALVEEQLRRIQHLREESEEYPWVTGVKAKGRGPIVVGFVGGDGIGPYIIKEAERVLEFMLAEKLSTGEVVFREIEGLTIERRAKLMQSVPEDVMEAIKGCDVILKGPTTTPSPGDPYPNLESANVILRRELDLFANVRPVRIPEEGIDWVFFRENTEGEYALGSRGINVTDDLAVDFKVTTTIGAERIIRMAFEYAKRNGINRVTVVTKANIIKTTDGKFLSVAERVARDYPGITWDHWFVDIFAAKLMDRSRRSTFRVIVLPNLYGDIITDEAAELQGGVGTAGSANIGKRYAMFEAVHGSALRMVEEGRAIYADPTSILRASAMLLRHIGFMADAQRLESALDVCTKSHPVTGRPDGLTSTAFTDYLLETLRGMDTDTGGCGKERRRSDE